MENNWRPDLPDLETWVEVWHLNKIVEAKLTKIGWLDRNGKRLLDVTHWRYIDGKSN